MENFDAVALMFQKIKFFYPKSFFYFCSVIIHFSPNSMNYVMARYLDPRNDLTFKRIFGEHPDLLINFLNAIMPFEEGRHIIEIEYLPAEQVPENPGKKNSIVDVKCKEKNGRVFIIEMQMLWTDDFMKRLVFNAGKAYVRQLDKSVSYHLLQTVYTLAILNKNFDHKTDQFYHHYAILNKENSDEVTEGLEFVLVELEKFKAEKWEDRKIAALWLRFLKEVNEKTSKLPDDLADHEQIRKAAEICEAAAFTPEELEAYEAYWDIVRNEKTIREGALAQGRGEGEIIGLEKGEAIGLEKAVIRGHNKGHSIDTIAEFTDLSPDRILKILKDNGLT
jgi:predicted transposase/invertase (TIGR01784 family)